MIGSSPDAGLGAHGLGRVSLRRRAAIQRLLNPVQLRDVGIGVAVSLAAAHQSVRRPAPHPRRQDPPIAHARGPRPRTTPHDRRMDIGGRRRRRRSAAVGLTGWTTRDPLIALAVAVNIIVTGIRLMRRSAAGLMDRALPAEELATVQATLDNYRPRDPVPRAANPGRLARQRATPGVASGRYGVDFERLNLVLVLWYT